MSMLPECPTCFGLLTTNTYSGRTLSSRCRCGDREPTEEDQRITAMVERELRRTAELNERRAA